MKNEYIEKTSISVVGTLEKNDDDKFIIRVELKDSVEEYDVVEILEKLLGQEVKIYGEEEI